MVQRVCLLVLIGLPAAGKSTFCRRLLQIPQTLYKIIHISYDDFLEFPQKPTETATAIDSLYKTQRSTIFNIIAELVKNLSEIPKHLIDKIKISKNNVWSDYLILCDDNHYYRSMRSKLFQLCKANNCAYVQVYFECSEELSLQRNAARSINDRVPENIIKQMSARIEKPNLENKWENSTLTVNSDEDAVSIFEKLIELILNDFKEVHERKSNTINIEPSVDVQKQTVVHKLDLLLRRRISDLLRMENNTDSKKIYSLQLNDRRKEILQEIRKRSDVTESKLNEYVNLLNKN